MTVELRTFADVREAYRQRGLRQALYDEGAVVMEDALITLHGDAHRDRRRLENRLFRREIFQRWEDDLLGPTIDAAFRPAISAGEGDLVPLAYRTTISLTAFIAGIDGAGPELESMVRTFSEGAILVHSTRDREEVRAEVREAMARFEERYLAPAIERRRAEPRPDVLSTLLGTGLSADVVLREVCFYLQAGAHSTANAFTFTVHELFGWWAEGAVPSPLPTRRELQQAVHETLRLHPASPVAWRRADADITLRSGLTIPEGELVVLDLAAANRDPAVFGADADSFRPGRRTPEGVAPWGHSFGGGVHACIGMELDGGTEDGSLSGTVALMAEAFLAAGGRPHPDRPPVRDERTERLVFSSYPVRFGTR